MKLVYALITISLGIIAFGLYVIVEGEKTEQATVNESSESVGVVPAPVPEESQSDVPAVDAEPGSERWCEMMMQKANDEWSDEESQTFADNCIYDN